MVTGVAGKHTKIEKTTASRESGFQLSRYLLWHVYAEIVDEVKQSEEWEEVKMSIWSTGVEHGKEIGEKIGEEKGISIGRADSILDCLAELGPVPDDLAKQIRSQKDLEVLKRWLKLALQADSINDFIQKI